MYGPDEVLQDVAAAPDKVRGIVPKTCTRIFTAIAADKEIVKATVTCSYLEVYNERVNDLLMLGQDLKLREDKDKGVYIEGLAAIEVANEQARGRPAGRGKQMRLGPRLQAGGDQRPSRPGQGLALPFTSRSRSLRAAHRPCATW